MRLQLFICIIFFLCVDVVDCDPNEIVEATLKYDGSMGIAFLWEDQVMVTTRRNMISEQAIWARQWVNRNCNLNIFRVGYTYLFEIIYQNNTMVVSYPFEGLVLLAVADESGQELPYEEVLHYARSIGFFMVTPRITAPYTEVLWYCGGIDLTSKQSRSLDKVPCVSGALPVHKQQQEGWVVKFKNARRQKIVYSWFKKISRIANLVHPQVVWLLVKHDKLKEAFGDIPNRFVDEVNRIIRALGRKFLETVGFIEKHLAVTVSLKAHKASRSLLCKVIYESDGYEDFEEDTSEEDILTSGATANENGEKCRQDIDVIITTKINDLVEVGKQLLLNVHQHEYLVLCNQGQRIGDWFINLSPFYSQNKENFYRLPVLDFICPTSYFLEGYEPSDNFKQTWCQKWKKLQINQVQFLQELLQENNQIPPFLQLSVEIIVFLLKFLDV